MRLTLLLSLLLVPSIASAQTASIDNMLLNYARLTVEGFTCPPEAPENALQCAHELWVTNVQHVSDPSVAGHIGLYLTTMDTYLDLLTLQRFILDGTVTVLGWSFIELDVMRFMSRVPDECRADIRTNVPGVADGVYGNDFGAFLQEAYNGLCDLPIALQPFPEG